MATFSLLSLMNHLSEVILVLTGCAMLFLPERRPPSPSSPCLAKWQRVHNFIGFSKFMCDCDDSEAQSEREEASASVLM